MHDGRWMFTRRIDPEEHNGNQCTIIGIRECKAIDALVTVEWLHERAAGYPKRDIPWHRIGCLHDGRPIPPPTIATRSG